jgi:hypothetical protein
MGDLSIDGRIILRRILKKQDLRIQTRFTGYITEYNRSLHHCELPDSIKGGTFLH